MWLAIKEFIIERSEDFNDYVGGKKMMKGIGAALLAYLFVCLLVGWYWSFEPDAFDVVAQTKALDSELNRDEVVGSYTTATVINLADRMVNKTRFIDGGYIRNDVFPPGLWLDNIKRWEFGVLVQIRDVCRWMRKDTSRSQSQSNEDKDLIIAEPQFNFDNNSWILPSTESEYRLGIKALKSYLSRLADPKQPGAQFYARADNLRNWLTDVETRLGSLSQRLSESVGKRQFNVGLAGDTSAQQSTPDLVEKELKTSWFEIDDVFYEARGTAWALIHLLKAIELDFKKVLQDKNAEVSFRQIIVELEATQETVWSPMILNGSGFGMLANHSLTMASYISRANAAIIDLRSLLVQG
jgi:hypothetical protein